ncbi:MAG: hypothetical protein AABX50_00380 [Nanoarchaeota archaeon]
MKKEDQKAEKELREIRRQTALKNLVAQKLSGLAVAYFAQDEKSGYGSTPNDAVEQFLYKPAIEGANAYDLKSGEEFDLVYKSLLGSRKDGKRYSGQVAEYDIIKTGAEIIQDSLTAITVGDLMNLIGSENIPKGYADKYIADLAQSGDEKEKELAGNLIGLYLSYFTTKGVSKSLDMRAGAIKGGLEKLVQGEAK